MNHENKGEENLVLQFSKYVQTIFEYCLIFDKNNFINEITELKKTEYNLEKEEDKKNNINLLENDFIENNLMFLLIYNNLDQKSKNGKIRNKLITIIEMLSLIIKDNVDIFSIVGSLNQVFKNLVLNNYDKVHKLNLDDPEKINILTHCYMIIVSNYNYILTLFTNNFGLAPKIFKELTNDINFEIDKIIKALISGCLHLNLENTNINDFITQTNLVYEKSKDFLEYNNINWYNYISQIYEEFIQINYDNNLKFLINKIKEEEWNQLMNINKEFQEVFDFINNLDINTIEENENFKNFKTLTIRDLKEENEEKKTDENSNYFIIKNKENNHNKHKVIHFFLYIIKFIYESLFLYKNLKDKLRKDIVAKIYKVIDQIILNGKMIIIDSSDGKINKKKTITEKESSLLISMIYLIETMLQKFFPIYPNQILQDNMNDIKKSTQEVMIILLNRAIDETINLIDGINFEKYPICEAKKYNPYILKFSKMKTIYDNMKYGFNNDDIIKIYNEEFKLLFEKMEKVIHNKPRIENENELKQFRKEMTYIRKVLEMFDLINTKEYIEKIEELSIFVNPNKITKKKKKIDKKDDEEEKKEEEK